MTEEKRRGHTILISKEDTPQSLESLEAEAPGAPATAAVRSDNAEVLYIDGKPVPFTKNDEGYQIHYLPPAPSLIEAARNFVDIQREIVE